MSTDEQDVSARLAALAALGVGPDRIYVDKGLTGTNRARPGPREALAACRAGDHLVALHKAGEHPSAELAELFGVARSTVYRALERAATPAR